MPTVRWLILALFLPTAALASEARAATPAHAAATPAADVDQAVTLLSRYPSGLVPVEPAIMHAIATLGAAGTPDEVSLLRNLVENERAEVRDAATTAIGQIRGRQHADERSGFARSLPDTAAVERAAEPLRKAGLGREEALCAAYAQLVIGPDGDAVRAQPGASSDGDAAELLSTGHPWSALVAASNEKGPQARLLEARAREDVGDVRGAVGRYALLAAAGDPDARAALSDYGVDTERLLLGLLAAPQVAPVASGPSAVEVLDVLVQNGSDLTVAVLAERTRSASPSDRATAADALARMIEGAGRQAPLPTPVQQSARLALAQVAVDDPVHAIASEALKAP